MLLLMTVGPPSESVTLGSVFAGWSLKCHTVSWRNLTTKVGLSRNSSGLCLHKLNFEMVQVNSKKGSSSERTMALGF